LDLDETVLDNSAFDARLVTAPVPLNEVGAEWTKWSNEIAAGVVPGAIDFLQFAHANGVTPIYITNRKCDSSKDEDPMVEVLRKLQVPLDSPVDRLFCARDSKDTDKTPRRRLVAAKFRILLLFGDQLGDFLTIPPGEANLAGREKLFIAHQSLWGERWFQLPNPMYGSWEGAVGYTVAEKLKHLRQ
jgi:acid phosphatase